MGNRTAPIHAVEHGARGGSIMVFGTGPDDLAFAIVKRRRVVT
jgi:hypothetical protein